MMDYLRSMMGIGSADERRDDAQVVSWT